MRIKEILAIKGNTLFTITPEKSLSEAVALMADNDVGSLVCFEHGQMVGMLTFREALNTIRNAGANWASIRVADCMNKTPVSGRPDMEVDELRRLMLERHMRYLPVLEGNTLLGVVSFHDVARAIMEEQGFENSMLKAYIRDWPAGESKAA